MVIEGLLKISLDKRIASYSSNDMNAIVEDNQNNIGSWYDRKFNIFSHLKLDSDGLFRFTKLMSNPTFLNGGSRCATFTANGSISVGSAEIVGKPTHYLDKFCNNEQIVKALDEMQGVVRYSNGDSEIDKSFVQAFLNAHYKGLAETISNTLTNAGFTNLSLENLKDTLEESTIKRLQGLKPNIDGYMKLLHNEARDNSNITFGDNAGNLIELTDVDASGKYVGERKLSEVLELTKERSNPELLSIINGNSGYDDMSAVVVASDSYYNAIVSEAKKEIRDPLVQSDYEVETEEQDGIKRKVFYWDGLPIVPMSEVNRMDKYTKSTTHMIGIIATGVIGKGCGFLPSRNGRDVALKVIENQDVDVVGTDDHGNQLYRDEVVSVISKPLANTAIANLDLVSVSVRVTSGAV